MGSFPRGEEPGAACSARCHAGCEEPRLARGVQQLQIRALIKKTPAVIKNDSAGVTTGVSPSACVCCLLCGGREVPQAVPRRSRGCIPHRDLLHNPWETPPLAPLWIGPRLRGWLRNVLITHCCDFPAFYVQQVLKCLQNEKSRPGYAACFELSCAFWSLPTRTIRGF